MPSELSSEVPHPPPALPGRRRKLLAICGVLVGFSLAVVAWRGTTGSVDAKLREGRRLLSQSRFSEAAQVARDILKRNSDVVAAWELAAEVAIAEKDFSRALEALDHIPDDAPHALASRLRGSQLAFDQGELARASDLAERAVTLDPQSLPVRQRLSYLLGLQSRHWDALPHRFQQVLLGGNEPLLLLSLCLGEGSLENPEQIEQFFERGSRDPGVQLALARLRLEQKDHAAAIRFAEAVCSLRPDWSDPQAKLGLALAEGGDEFADRFDAWSQQLSPQAESHPGVWYARAVGATRRGQNEVALRCLWETLLRDPVHTRATYQLGQGLSAKGMSSAAAPFLERSQHLEAFAKSAELAYRLDDAKQALETAEHAEQLGLMHEAYAWASIAARRSPASGDASTMLARLAEGQATWPPQRSLPGTNPAEAVDLSQFPVRPHRPPATREAVSVPAALVTSIQFSDQAQPARLHFEYVNGGAPSERGILQMYEVVGGGVAVIDFDQDGLPDVYFPQGGKWPVDLQKREHLDQLFRNCGDGQFQRVTDLASIVEPGFSQGASAGDIDNDGFPELYVANIGPNGLLTNNGDGTFVDTTERAGVGDDRYTVSALIADLNGDSAPEILSLNYLSGDDLFTRLCGDSEGNVGSCLPQLFPPERSKLYLNRGDGTFEDVSDDSGLAAYPGKGLGLVTVPLEGSPQPALFIANDVGPKFLFVNQSRPGERPRLAETGLAAGVALNRHGQYESGMGVAAGDCDGDGRMDLFVTNFDEETNTLYRQVQSGLFVDGTVASGLSRKFEPNVGWGAQFLDADLDGWLDLLFTNGHVNDLRRNGKPFQMPAQFFHNSGAGKFRELPAATLGSYFSQRLLGRGVARLDWNRDGREDALITHLDAPAALLTNETRSAGHALSLELRGVASSRDAIGAEVRAHLADRILVRHLSAGDGNQVSNERRLLFGLGDEQHIKRLEVHWPSGMAESFDDLPADTAWLCIEGRGKLVQLPEGRSPERQ